MSLSEVIIYDGPNIFRRFKPVGLSFSTTLTGMHDKQHDFVLVARDVSGKEAVGAALDTNSREHAIYMCADMQNNLNYAQTPNPDNTKLNGFNPLGSYVTGWDGGATGVLINNEDLVPKGFDNAVGGFTFGSSHQLTTSGGLEWSLTRHVFYHGSRDCCVLENPYRGYLGTGSVLVADTQYADTVARFVSFTPNYDGINILRVDLTTTFKKSCLLGASTGLESSLFRVSFPADSFPNYAYTLANGSKVTGVRDPGGVPVGLAPLQPNGYVAVYPDFYGSCALYSLGRGLYFRLENGVITLGYKNGGQTIASGTVWKNSILLVRDKFGSSDLSNFDKIRTYFGASGVRAFAPTMTTGSITSGSFFPFELQASGSQAMFSTSPADFPNDLPAMVHGLNGKCDAGIYDLASQSLKPIGVTEGVGYTRFSTATARNIWIGNLAVADNPDVWVQLIDHNWQGPHWRLHNPTDSAITTKVTALLPPIAGAEGTFTIPAGSTIDVTLLFVDQTPPTVPAVTDTGDTTSSHRSLSASWTSSDSESAISDYAVALGTTPSDTGEYLVPWSSRGTSTSGTVSGTFESGKTYYLYVKATNGGGLASVGTSDGIQVQSSILQAKSQPDRTSISIGDVVITAAFPSIQRYYVEEYDRSSAIVFTNSGTFNIGDEVSIGGEIRTVGGERMIIADPVSVSSSGNALPEPLFANNRDLGGAALGYEPGVFLGVGPSNLAYLFRVCGRVKEVGTGYFMLDDGSGVPAAERKTGVKVIHGFGNPNPEAFVSVTGVSCVDRVNGVSYRAMRTRSASDVVSPY
ncbi:MAG: hypothetical protein HYX78_10805 [Armatimonadetes bacterium]|nr:hypothetical protein [Armatimonadota bacterium]